MADNKSNNPKGRKPARFSFNFSWLYLLLIFGIGCLLFNNQQSADPKKIEWQQVKTMAESGDIEEIVFVRNDIRGEVKVRPERLAKYADQFPNNTVPRRAPHFYFLVSARFDPEENFAKLNENLPVGDQFKVVIQNGFPNFEKSLVIWKCHWKCMNRLYRPILVQVGKPMKSYKCAFVFEITLVKPSQSSVRGVFMIR